MLNNSLMYIYDIYWMSSQGYPVSSLFLWSILKARIWGRKGDFQHLYAEP